MDRTISTAQISSFNRLSGPNVLKITSLSELQNLDEGVNGKGLNMKDFRVVYESSELKQAQPGWIDVTTFGREGWNEKETGIWNVDEVKWRTDHVKGFLSDM